MVPYLLRDVTAHQLLPRFVGMQPVAQIAPATGRLLKLFGDTTIGVTVYQLHDELLSNVKTPLTREEVGVLIDIFPEGGMYGVEWDLLKLVESYLIEAPSSEEYRKLITACPSEEWRETMQARLDNWENNKQ